MKDNLFKSFADPTRLRILGLLSLGELCVCDLMSVLSAPQSKVSQHLAFLRSAGLVVYRQEGKWRHYSLTKPVGRVHARLVGCLGECFSEISSLKRDRVKLRKILRAKEKAR
ncbi:MAG: transcriptional regulator [Elusimicrobia bacterium CG11_big_fil_rev_8_21_14_0_20_64_6]|nr:MAG: transcriptional regulator [Elusimicrobia bacterium CG11_big_fil_rev_8_21_14_0_20_64_6]